MVCRDKTTTPTITVSSSTTIPFSPSPSTPSSCSSLSPSNNSNPPPSSPLPAPVVLSPCAACKILRRRCVEKCVLAPYFPPTDPLRFTIAHRVFGASNIIKMLQELPESQRADTVSSMVYEANARIRDPIYGCAGAISQLQNQVSELQAQLAKAQAEIVNLQSQQSDLLALICLDHMSQSQQPIFQQQQQEEDQQQQILFDNASFSFEDGNSLMAWENNLWA